MTTKINTTRFGEISVEPSQIITFSKGIPGFEKLKRWMLFHELNEKGEQVNGVVVHLQSVDDASVSLPLTEPSMFGFNYVLELSDSEVAELKLDDPSDIVILVTLSNKNVLPALIKAEKKAGTDIFVNISAPLLINSKSRIGIQKALNLEKADTKIVIKA